MSPLVDFLLARIAEDEALARGAVERSSYGWSDNAFSEAVELAENEGARKQGTDHIARWDPARVLAECDAKRRVVDSLRDLTDAETTEDQAWALERGDRSEQVAIATMRLLALPYADHPDYRDEWRS